MDTWIYLIKDNRTGYYKIGKSNNPAKRLRELKKQPTLLPYPHDFELVNSFWVDEAIEIHFHNVLARFRKRGEWFDLPQDIVELITEFMTKMRQQDELWNYFDQLKRDNKDGK